MEMEMEMENSQGACKVSIRETRAVPLSCWAPFSRTPIKDGPLWPKKQEEKIEYTRQAHVWRIATSNLWDVFRTKDVREPAETGLGSVRCSPLRNTRDYQGLASCFSTRYARTFAWPLLVPALATWLPTDTVPWRA